MADVTPTTRTPEAEALAHLDYVLDRLLVAPHPDLGQAILAALAQSGYRLVKADSDPIEVRMGILTEAEAEAEFVRDNFPQGVALIKKEADSDMAGALVALREALERIQRLTLDVPAAHGDPESFYLAGLRTAIGTAARVLADTELAARDAAERLRREGARPCHFVKGLDDWTNCSTHGWTGFRDETKRVTVCPVVLAERDGKAGGA